MDRDGASAPTYPECDEEDLRATLEAIRPLNPMTIFHEPINIRAKNVARIAAHAAELGLALRTDAGENPIRTRSVAGAVRALIESEGLERPASTAPTAKQEIFKISAERVAEIRTGLKRLRAAISEVKGMPKIKPIIDEIEALLPGTGET